VKEVLISSRLSEPLVRERGLLALLLELVGLKGVGLELEIEVLEPVRTFNLTSGTSNFPSAPGWRIDLSRLLDCDAGVEDLERDCDCAKRASHRIVNLSLNLAMSSSFSRGEGADGAEEETQGEDRRNRVSVEEGAADGCTWL
jgi:hypothetical protein